VQLGRAGIGPVHTAEAVAERSNARAAAREESGQARAWADEQ
jgi:hypothetical protein